MEHGVGWREEGLAAGARKREEEEQEEDKEEEGKKKRRGGGGERRDPSQNMRLAECFILTVVSLKTALYGPIHGRQTI